jgi:hypothetical protein
VSAPKRHRPMRGKSRPPPNRKMPARIPNAKNLAGPTPRNRSQAKRDQAGLKARAPDCSWATEVQPQLLPPRAVSLPITLDTRLQAGIKGAGAGACRCNCK